MLSFGAFPDVPLAQAREKRDDARKLVAAGTDPARKRKEDKVEATISAGNTFEVLAQEYIAKVEQEGAAEQTLSKNEWLLLDLASPLAKRPSPTFNRPKSSHCCFLRYAPASSLSRKMP